MPQEKEYVHSDLTKETDQERLSSLEQTWDPTTIRHMEMLGVSEGWKCLDVGAGYGSITEWMADRTGPQGKVVVTDIRPELHRETGGNVEIRQHDILTAGLESDYYDLVHCRLLLVHVGDPEKALSNMARALKPGGWLLVEEVDNFTHPVFDTNYPDADFYYSWYHETCSIQLRLKYIDVQLARNVRRLLEQLGLREIGGEGTTMMVRGGEPWSQFEITTYKALAEGLKEVLTDEEKKLVGKMDKIINLLENPSFYYISHPLFSAWGRKPVK